jgi:RNA recognition motif-containing protein
MVIFVANIPFKSRQNELKILFSQYGVVKRAYIVYNKETRRSKGFGFVEMPDESEAKEAIDKLNGFEYKEKILVVTKATSSKKEVKQE